LAENLDWGANVEDLPDEKLNEWEFNVKHSNDRGESETIASRIDPSMGRIIDELIQEAKASGLPIKTRADFTRLAIFRCVQDVQNYLKTEDENITHYLILEKQNMAEANKSAMLERVLVSVQKLTKGMRVLHERRQDWDEINKRVSSWLSPILEMHVNDEFLARMYITELFEYSSMKAILEELETNHKVSQAIKEARKIYES
tara:strand:+ start:1223 stop:1828 length:606 start_codon:yes stop_codon:yes gene_type:complete